MIDPIQKAREINNIVTRGNQRKYYRFRPAPFYGGIATADCVGCCLCCIFCWSYPIVTHPEHRGQYYSPEQVSSRLIGIARKKRFKHIRISGNEPTLARDHLIEVLSLIPENFLFILETNGILIGHDISYANDLAAFKNLHVRVSIKGYNEVTFEALTGYDRKGFQRQLQALENLLKAGIVCHPAVMTSFSSKQEIEQLRKRLGSIHPNFSNFEEETLIPYPEVERRLAMAGYELQR